MRVEGRVYATRSMIDALREDQALQQVANVAHLPGIVGASLAMPDVHWGYGFPIGGVAAMREEDGVVSPGGVGYDINCGVRLLRSRLTEAQVRPRTAELVQALFDSIPTGVGAARSEFRLPLDELRRALSGGARWAVEKGYGRAEDLDELEEGGCLPGAEPGEVSPRALERGRAQLGTLGSGNHFGEIQVVDTIFDPDAARALELFEGQVVVMLHTGSRGLGHQVCTDFIATMQGLPKRHGFEIPDRQLSCAPIRSPEGQRYLGAMSAAANFAFANRQIMTDLVRRSFERVLGMAPDEHGLHVLYDVCHNIAKFEQFEIDGHTQRVCVHRKGATRAYPPGHRLTPEAYREVGQPVLIPGDMGRCSFVLVGTERGFRETFGSSCHGAGRLLSRTQARKQAKGRNLRAEMKELGVVVRSAGRDTVAEELPEAYKDVSEVVEVVELAGISRKVARLRPMGVIKG